METDHVFETKLLTSGVQIVGQPMKGVESAALGMLVGAGARDEEPRQFGIARFTEQMLLRGTQHMDARTLSDRLDALGIGYDSSSGVEMTVVSAVMLGDRLSAALDILSDVVRFPSFPQDYIPTVSGLIAQERRQREDQPGSRAMELVRQKLFAGSPFSHDVLGTQATVEGITRDDLLAFWTDRYTANNTIISVAGNINWDVMVDQLECITANWPQGSGPALSHEPLTHRGTMVVQRDTNQENICFAYPGVPVSDPYYYAARLLSQILGGSSTSRLFQEVREKRGLAYSVAARFDGLEKTGYFRIYVGTSAERAHESVGVVLDELEKLTESGVTEDELRLAKTRVKSQIIMRSESTLARMGANMRSWWYERQLHTLQEIADLIDHVTAEEILTLARTLDPLHHLNAVAIGPRSEEELFGRMLARS